MPTSSNHIESSAVRRASRRPTKVFKGQKWVNSVAYFPDGQRIASGSNDKTIVIWNVESGRQDGQPIRHDSSVGCIAVSPDGRRIASGMQEGGLVIWDVLTREVVHELKGGGVHRLVFSPDGRWIATAPTADERMICLWDADTGRPGREPLECDGSVFCVAFSPDGSRIAAGFGGGSFQVIDISTGESVVGPVKGHKNVVDSTMYCPVSSIVYSPDGRLLVTASWDKSIRAWDSKTGVQVGTQMGHEDSVLCVSAAADGRRIASGGWDGTVRVWDLETQLQVGDPFDAHGRVLSVAFSPDARYIVSGGNHDTVCLLDTDSLAGQSSPSPPTASNQKPAPLRRQRQAHAKPHNDTSSINSSLLDLLT
ncbi:WD40 repeat-like protein [Leucogyrophana mollusca]|uniref:WD40 repeat-like protein n=1 Tax=Leucogyrophana mollusca TaxID=85980 RepID=A0ACB8AYZ9_9AGAM|nr:WD40 repeat-like protein [Leucogyrophana mollusca]